MACLRTRRVTRRSGAWLLIAVALSGCVRSAESATRPEATRDAPQAVGGAGAACVFWRDLRTAPRPLRIHVLRVDLAGTNVRVEACLAPDPDGDGPAEAALAPPTVLVADPGLVAGVNANFFAGLPDAAGKRSSNWHRDMPVEILGLAVHGGELRSPPQPGYCGVWVTEAGEIGLGAAVPTAGVREAAAGSGLLVVGGKSAVAADDRVLHPRTAAGTDAGRRRLWLAVVDGRQRGYSEGMSLFELAGLMLELGCTEAINLDGGGSSVLLARDEAGAWQTLNKPSGGSHRPLPVVLAVRRVPPTGGR